MIVLFGLAGSGKGTQGKALAEIFGWRWITTGAIIRADGRWNELIDKGNIIPDEAMYEILEREFIKIDAEGYDVVLDGFPRNREQAEWLMTKSGHKVDGGVVLEVPKEELYRRLSMRAGVEEREDDQERAAIDRRFEIYEQNIEGILAVFEAYNVPVIRVDGVGVQTEVTERLVKVVKELAPAATEQEDDVNGEEIEKSYGE